MVNIMKLLYGDTVLGEVTTNHSMTVDEALYILDINMDAVARENGWDDWDWEQLHMEY